MYVFSLLITIYFIPMFSLCTGCRQEVGRPRQRMFPNRGLVGEEEHPPGHTVYPLHGQAGESNSVNKLYTNIHKLYTNYTQVIHKYTQIIHKLYTNYTQIIHK